MEIRRNISLKDRNTFGMDVRAAFFIEYDSVEELQEILSGGFPKPFLHIGGGSNLLFTGDFPGTILHSRIKFIELLNGAQDGKPFIPGRSVNLVRAGAGVIWDELCEWAAERGLWGIENLSLIPGEVGAAAVQNIGAYGREAKDVIKEVECYDIERGKIVTLSNEDCNYSYRESIFKQEAKGRLIVTAVTISLTGEFSPILDYGHLREEIDDDRNLTPWIMRETIIGIRRRKLPDPAVTGSAGSFFRNPFVEKEVYSEVVRIAREEGFGEVPRFESEGLVKIPAAWLIEKCGWKNFREENVGVWRQPLVIVNATGKASPEEISGLEKRIIESVRSRFGITLEPEIEHI